MNYLPMSKKLLQLALVVSLIALSPLVYAQTEAPVENQEFTVETAQPVSNVDEISNEITTDEVFLSAIPPRVGDDGSLVGDPGDTVQTQVRIRNNSNATVTVESYVEDFMVGEDGKTPIPVSEATNSNWSLAKWVTLVSPRNTIPAFGSATIPVVIQVPDDALPGGHYAMITHQPVDANSTPTQKGEIAGQTAVNPRVGTLVYFKVNGDITENAVIRNIDIPKLSEFGPVPIKFEIENLSDIHVQPQTKVTIHDIFGRQIEDIEVRSLNVFPYTTRAFETEWDRVWGFGRYTAEFNTAYGSQGKLATAVYSFWLIPYTLIAAILFILLALTGITIAIRRHWQHRNSVEQQHITLLEDRIRQLEDELQQ